MQIVRLTAVLATFFVAMLSCSDAKAIETVAKQAILMDFNTGTILLDKNAHAQMAPASMSKLMTVFMVFERLKDGRLSLEDTFTVSENAWRKGGTKSGSSTMFLEPNKKVHIEDLLRGIIVQSGNDACITIAENLAGSEDYFAKDMTIRAKELGLKNSNFINSTGWPNKNHLMTPYDLVVLARHIINDFPEYYSIYSERSFTYNGIKQGNRNPLLYRVKGADGLKTGHTEASGFGLIGSVKRNNRRLIVVVNGLNSERERAEESAKLIEWGFREFDNYSFFSAGEKVSDAEVWLGQKPTVPMIVNENVKLTLSPRTRKKTKVKVVYERPIAAPITKGDRIGTLKITVPNMETLEYPLVAEKDVKRLGFIGRIMAALEYIIIGLPKKL
ncbi:MAG: D-alanyl-D-alanine carboxypeptidase [Alphaproteobacteria bacterium]|nr:D-alanyl-D-alanine carboxypeptidase [Alphaproteobacteria bacterium]